MSKEHVVQFFGTQAQILISEWKSIAKLIMAHSVHSKDRPVTNIEDLESFDIENLENINFGASEELPHILAEKNIKIALQGPFGGLLRQKMAAYALIARVRLEIHLSKEELFKTRRTTDIAQRIPEQKLEKFDSNQLDEMQAQMDELAEQCDQQWQEFISEWSDEILNFFAQSQLLLTEREIKELKDEDISTELLPRFIEVGLKLPQKEYPEMSFADYLLLKAMLTIQSALSRQHLPHDETQIQQKLHGFKSSFAKMQKREQQILEEQKQLSSQILAPLKPLF